jgi:ubiquinone/menaquinone biosynthesis C-methylase UbiE
MARAVHSLLIHRIHDRALLAAAARHLHGRVIDIGCGEKPYETLLAPHVREYVGVDHTDSPHDRSRVDLDGTAYALSVPDASFDGAVCTAVLEHLEEPEDALRECLRVLRPGAAAIYTVPFIWHLHEEPRDFYRYSVHGLRYLFEKAGFEIVEIRPLSGFWVTFGQLLAYNVNRLNRGPLRWLRIVDAATLLVQGVAWLLDRIDRTEQWTWMYLVVARRPSTEAPAAPISMG